MDMYVRFTGSAPETAELARFALQPAAGQYFTADATVSRMRRSSRPFDVRAGARFRRTIWRCSLGTSPTVIGRR